MHETSLATRQNTAAQAGDHFRLGWTSQVLNKAGNKNIFPRDKDISTRRDKRGWDGAGAAVLWDFTATLTSFIRLG